MRFTLFLAAAAVTAIVWVGQVQAAGTPSPIVTPEDNAPAAPAKPAEPTPAQIETEEEKAAAALRARVSQLMLVTLTGVQGPNNDDRTLLARYALGGVVIPVTASPKVVAEYVAAVRLIASRISPENALFVGTDLYSLNQSEGKTLATFIQLPSLLSVAAANDSASTVRLGKLVAEHLNTMGFNLNIGPCLDLASTLTDARGTTQTFGSDAAVAAQTTKDLVTTFVESGLMVMPVGFPGGGLNRQGESPAALITPLPRLAREDLLPFRAAIEAGAEIVNVGNTLVPTLDPSSPPASLSSVAIQDLLKDEWKFKGVVVAGPMDAADLRRVIATDEAALRAMKAGADMLYWAQSGPHVAKAVEAIARAVEQGEIPASRIDEALARINALKESKGLRDQEAPDAKKAVALEKRGRYPKEAYEIERRAITLVKNDGDLLPFSKDNRRPIGITGVACVTELKEALDKLHIKQVVEQPIMTARHLGEIEDFEIQRLVADRAGFGTVICVFTGMRRGTGEARLVHELKAKGARVVVVLIGYPTHVPKLAEADAIVLAYCETYHSKEAIKAVADVLTGQCPFNVLSGVDALKVKAGVPETFDVQKIVRSPAGRLPVSLGAPFEAGMSVSYNSASFVKKTEWNFGDGQSAKEFRVQHVYQTPGEYPLTVTVTDQEGDTRTGSFTIKAE